MLVFPFIALNLADARPDVIDELIIISLFFEPGLKVVKIQTSLDIDNSEDLEDGLSGFVFCFVEFLLEEITEVAIKSVD